MSEIRPTIEPAPEPRTRRRATSARASLGEVLALVARAATLADGFALLERAPLECIAVLLGVEPRAIERARAALADAEIREEALRELARVAGRRPAATAPAEPPPRPRDADALLAAARGREDGLALLLSAAPETAAIAFGVHPALVHAARARAGEVGPPAPGASRP